MSRYRVVAEITITMSVIVEADSEDEAIGVAEDCEKQSFCHQCASGDSDVWTLSGELDGDLDGLTAELEGEDTPPPEPISLDNPLGVRVEKAPPKKRTRKTRRTDR